MGIQESKHQEVTTPIIEQLLGVHIVGFAYSLVVDSAGGIICRWNCAIFSETYRFCQPRFVAVKGS